jgi:hypothetical protein
MAMDPGMFVKCDGIWSHNQCRHSKSTLLECIPLKIPNQKKQNHDRYDRSKILWSKLRCGSMSLDRWGLTKKQHPKKCKMCPTCTKVADENHKKDAGIPTLYSKDAATWQFPVITKKYLIDMYEHFQWPRILTSPLLRRRAEKTEKIVREALFSKSPATFYSVTFPNWHSKFQ